MASLNINSLLLHIDELRVFMSSSKIDILMIYETKLDSTIHDNEVHLTGLEIVRTDRKVNGRNRGGVCIYLRTNLNSKIRNDLSNDKLEWLTIEITKPRSKAFLVSTWYRPPNSPSELFNEFEKVIDKIDAENKELFLLGDLNCDFLSGSTTYSTSPLTNVFDIYGPLRQLIIEPTRVTPPSQTLLDLCITNACDKVINSGVLPLGISDHYLVYMTRKAHYDRTGPRTIDTAIQKLPKRKLFV